MTTNYERVFAGQHDVYECWIHLNTVIKEGMDLRRYELATLAAALALRSSYCSLAHGRVLSDEFGEQVVDIVTDRTNAGLTDTDIAVLDLAEQVALDATAVRPADRQRLIDLGITEHEVELVVLAAAARSFFSKSLDGLGAMPDPSFNDLDPALRDVLVVGTPIEQRSHE